MYSPGINPECLCYNEISRLIHKNYSCIETEEITVFDLIPTLPSKVYLQVVTLSPEMSHVGTHLEKVILQGECYNLQFIIFICSFVRQVSSLGTSPAAFTQAKSFTVFISI